MDPCPFFRLWVGNLGLNLPSSSSTSNPYLYYCKIKLPNFPLQTTSLPLFTPDSPSTASSSSHSFTLTKPQLLKNSLTIDVYRRSTTPGCGLGSVSPKFLGRVRLVLDLTHPALLHNGWLNLNKNKNKNNNNHKNKNNNNNNSSSPELHLTLKLDSDPRFVFEFDGESECSPQIFQLQATLKQPVFSCKFGLRNSAADCKAKERKGWMLTIHDLSGSPVAAASMVTPFVASPGSDRVSRSNPGAWLILRPADATWTPWGRLEAWCDGSNIAYRFEILSGAGGGITLSTGSVSAKTGGKFDIDIMCNSPVSTPSSSFDDLRSESESGSGWCWMYGGFVMSSTVGGEKAQLQVGAQHVTCTEDAAVFVALAAAADLSVDACLPFSKKLRKELRQPGGEPVV